MVQRHSKLPTEQLLPNETRSFLIRPFLIETDPRETHESPHRHNFQEILWVRSGRGEHAIDGQPLPIQAQTFYLIAKGQVHQLITGIDLDGLVIRFTDAFLPNFLSQEMGHYQTVLFNNVTINHTLPVQPTALTNFERLLQQLLAEFNSQKVNENQEILRHLLTVLLIKLGKVQRELMDNVQTACPEQRLGAQAETAVDQETQLFHQFTLLLEQQFSQTHAVQVYAQMLNITPRHLSVITQRFVGRTAKHHIEDRLLLEAKRLLTFTNLSVKEIAHQLGYKDPSHFSKMFKKKTKTTPQMYKFG
jgi:AraC family transcriptional activator of pobA